MSSLDLTKKSEEIGQLLLDKGVTEAPIMRVGVALDISGSMGPHIPENLQLAFNQMMGVSVKFDDNGELDVFKFDDRCEYVGTSTPEEGDYDVFIKKNGIRARGGTKYAPIVDEAIKFFFKPKKTGGFLGFGGKTEAASDEPVLMLIITDGEPWDADETLAAMDAARKHNIYFHLVGIGGSRSSFPTIARLADELPNVGEVYLPNFGMSDSEVYSQLICDELIEWVGQNNTATA